MTAPRTRTSTVAGWVVLATIGLSLLAPAADAHTVTARTPTPTELRDQMLGLINRSRATRGLPRLRIDGWLSREALRHSRRMARQGRLFHTPGLASLISHEGGTVYGENLGNGRGLQWIRDAWLRHRDTRRILLDPRFRHAGVGVVHRDGFYWVTLQAFD